MRVAGADFGRRDAALCGCSFTRRRRPGRQPEAAAPERRADRLRRVRRRHPARPEREDRRRCASPTSPRWRGDGTWFRNAQTRYDSTTKAVPLILDGIAPAAGHRADRARPPALDLHGARQGRLPDRALRGGHGDVPGALLPAEPHAAAGDHPEPEGRPGRALRALHPARSTRAGGPTFWMKHALLPHGPWVYLPDGRMSRPARARSCCPGCRRCPASTTTTCATTTSSATCSSSDSRTGCSAGLIARLKSAGHLRRHADRRDGRPRLRVEGGRGHAPQRQPARTSTSWARCR